MNNEIKAPVRNIDTKETAKIIRGILKVKFPGSKFSVRIDGNSIDVKYTDGPALTNVQEYIGHMSHGTFDAMTDCAGVTDSELNGEIVRYGNRHLFINRDYSEAVEKAYAEWHNNYYGDSKIEYKEGIDHGKWGYQKGYCHGDHDAMRRRYEYMNNTGF